MEQQKRKISGMSAEEQAMFDALLAAKVPDMTLSKDGQFDVAWTIEQRAKFLIYKFHLDPIDLYIDAKTNNKTGETKEVLVVKAAGWFKIAHFEGWEESRTALQNANPKIDGFVIIKAQVRKKGSKAFFDGTGYAGKDEKGKDWWSVPALLGTAETRAVVRAIKMMCPISGVMSEEDRDIIDGMDGTLDKIERKHAAEFKQTSREEEKLVATEKKAKKTSEPTNLTEAMEFPPEFEDE